ncbi:IclR family transcriptional regulator [Amycolatopsis anabasis]|uniref:IclR family transcriptional regulator n=1 Tax=Amycolatopsis anabasis TaxID=1840409 RepID=UPI00131DB4EE|nr:IclR family transcriptional regulator [Amycolatopsis anabasis]
MSTEETAAREHRTVSRVTTILEAVAAEPGGVRLGVLAGALDAPKSSVHGLVKGLVATGYLREHDGGYLIGPALAALLSTGRPSLVDAARPALEELHERFDETVMLAALVGSSVVYLDTIESTRLIRYSAPRRRRRPVYPTSSGKSLLANLGERRIDAYLREHFPDPIRAAEVAAELARVRADGVAFNRGETAPDVSAAASVVREHGRVAASIAVAGPSTRMAAKLDVIAVAVREAAAGVSRAL